MQNIIRSNALGKDLRAGNKKLKITRAKLHAMPKKYKPTLDLKLLLLHAI